MMFHAWPEVPVYTHYMYVCIGVCVYVCDSNMVTNARQLLLRLSLMFAD